MQHIDIHTDTYTLIYTYTYHPLYAALLRYVRFSYFLNYPSCQVIVHEHCFQKIFPLRRGPAEMLYQAPVPIKYFVKTPI